MKKVSKKDIAYGYIGVSHNAPQRWEQHKSFANNNASTKLHKKMNKTGWVEKLVDDSNLYSYPGYAHCVILYAGLEMVEAYTLEKKLIKDHDLVDVGLNSKEGGTVPSGNDHITAEHFIYYIYIPKK